jgi:hypothetical protein
MSEKSESNYEAARRMREQINFRDPGIVPSNIFADIFAGQATDDDGQDFSASLPLNNPWSPRKENDGRLDYSTSTAAQEKANDDGIRPLQEMFAGYSTPATTELPTEFLYLRMPDEFLDNFAAREFEDADGAGRLAKSPTAERTTSTAIAKAAPQATAEPQAQAEQVNPDAYCEDDLIAAVLAVEAQGEKEHEGAFYNRIDGWLMENNRPTIFSRLVE